MSAQSTVGLRGAWLVAALLLCGRGEAAQESPDWVLLASSPGDERTLEHRGSTLRCSFLGGLEWSAEVDLDPKVAAVTKSGRAFVAGIRRDPSAVRPFVDFLVVLIFDTGGDLVQRQELRRTPFGGCSLGVDARVPWIRGLMLDEGSDQAVLRLKATGGPGEWWWTYKLSKGALMGGLYPRKVIEDRPKWFNLMDARIVPGEGWFVTLWSTGVCTKRERRPGARPGDTLVILDRSGRTLAYHNLGEFMEDPCSTIARVEAGVIELTSLEGAPLVLEVAGSRETRVKLETRNR